MGSWFSRRVTFEEVELAIDKFSGTEPNQDIITWLRDIEALAEQAGWDDFEKYLFLRRNVTGKARQMMVGEILICFDYQALHAFLWGSFCKL